MAAGVIESVRFEPEPERERLARETRAGFEVDTVTVRAFTGVSVSLTEKGIAPVDPLASIERLVKWEIDGAVFTAFTVTTKLELAVRLPSLTVTVTVPVPI